MRYALLSDIHANLPALNAVLVSAEAKGAEAYVISGDSVGYYFWPAEVFAAINDLDGHIIRGNHENMLLRAAADPDYRESRPPILADGVRTALMSLSPSDLSVIAGWPDSLRIKTEAGVMLVCHGAPGDTDRYVYPDTPDSDLAVMRPADARYVVMGHTHHPMVRDLDGVRFINPGSVGQPRDRRPGASWALLDSVTGEVEHFREDYDYEAVAAIARDRLPDVPFLSDALVRTS